MYQDFAEWAEIYRKPFIQSVTYIKYERTIAIIKDYFGELKTKEVARKDLQKFFNELSKKYEKLTIRTHFQHLLAFYQSLMDEGEIDRNPMNNIRYSGIVNKKKKKFLEVEDTKKILSRLDLEKANHLLIYIALKTGLRFAECLGLTPADLYVLDGMCMLSVNKTLDYKYTNEFKTTKTTTSVREISIDKDTYDLLVNFYQAEGTKEGESIFGSKHSASINRELYKICVDNSIDPISFHGLRHTHGSLLLRQGIPMISVSRRLGHASMSITQDIYIHLTRDQEDEDNKKIAKLLEVI